MLNKRNMVLCLLVLIAMGSFFVAPYLTMVGFSGIMAFYIIASDREKNYLAYFFFFIAMTLITCIVISTKTLDAIMNDKVNYRLSMLEGNGLNIVQWVADFQGSDFISYLFLYISAYLFGVNNEAFAFFYFVSFTLLVVGLYRITGNSFAIILFMFCCQYTFQGLYGNILRQSLALSFLVCALSCKTIRNGMALIILAAMSHFSFIMYGPYIFLRRFFQKVSTPLALAAFGATYVVGKYFFSILVAFFPTGSLFSEKAAVYDNDATFEGSDFGRKLGAIVFFIMIIEGGNLFQKYFLELDESRKRTLEDIRGFFIYGALIFFLCTSFEEISTRYAFNLMIFAFTYTILLVGGIKDYMLKCIIYLSLVALLLLMYVYINIVSNQFFYYGDLVSIISDDLPTILNKIGVF